ncbi:DUF3240 domain-containing protein [Helicobacter didelphidarum]|uniref:DUF3240 domain-containing protein n=2 Tax=Helicobacter didelphidarum TaxID=2040648 RepID=A0A3D8IG49_9HELI|nr:DUF3240 domain-containing protein [Helicobacter didelphidarum]
MLDVYMRFEIKDNVIDFLLTNGYDDFFFIDAKKYAAKNMLLSDEEQVSGRQNYANLRIYLNNSAADMLASLIKGAFSDVRVFAVECQPLGFFIE